MRSYSFIEMARVQRLRSSSHDCTTVLRAKRYTLNSGHALHDAMAPLAWPVAQPWPGPGIYEAQQV